MTSYYDVFTQFLDYVYLGFMLGLAPTLLITGAFYLALRLSKQHPKDASVPAAFTTFGTVCGILVGASRAPAVGGALPLVIAMVTLFITFIVEKKEQNEIRRLYMLSLLGFFLGIIFGAVYGAALRPPPDANAPAGRTDEVAPGVSPAPRGR
jgi:hypothetical protein